MMARLTRERLVRAALLSVLVAGVPVATFGAGYRASEAVLGDASAYLQRDHDVVRVNAESEDVDAEAARELATGSQQLEVVQVSAGAVYVVNAGTGEVWRMPTDTMQPQPVEQPPAAGAEPELAAGGEHAYLVDPADGSVALLEDPAGPGKSDVVLPDRAPATELVVDSTGLAWALSRERGELYAIDAATVVARHPVAEPGEEARLTLAGDRPVVYLPGRGKVVGYDRAGQRGAVTIPPVSGVELAEPGADDPVLVAVVPRTGELISADLDTGEADRTALTGRARHRFGPPVVARGRVYVPDYSDRDLLVVQLHPLQEQSYENVPGKVDFDVFARDGRVWVNDPYHPELLTFDRHGRPSWVDKHTGRGRPEATPEPTEPPEPPPPSPPPAPPGTEEPEPVEVPDVVGRDRLEACAEIKQAGLECDFVAEEAADGKGGEVLRTSPRAGETSSAGATVTIVFRTLPKTTVPPPGRTQEEACAAVRAAALTCRPEVAGYASSRAEYHLVVSYQPPAGTEVEVGSEVRVGYLERGPTYPVPNVVGMNPTQACQTLQTYFLQCAPYAEEVTWEPNVVHVQNVPAGTAIAAGTAVPIVYQDTAGLPLTRFRYQGQNRVQPAWYLSTGSLPSSNWVRKHEFGGVYGIQGGMPGLITVYKTRCQVACGMPTMWFFAPEPRAPQRPPAPVPGTGCLSVPGLAPCWTQPEPAFTCFGTQVHPQTRALLKMYSPEQKAWTYAVQGTSVHQHRRSPAGGGYVDESTICWVWHGVPPFPGSS